jgi:hypothetical protein
MKTLASDEEVLRIMNRKIFKYKKLKFYSDTKISISRIKHLHQ